MIEQQWQLQEAKNKFSNLVSKAEKDGPQIVTKHGKKAVVVLKFEEYEKLIRPKMKLVDFLRKSPLKDIDLELTRSKELPRKLEL